MPTIKDTAATSALNEDKYINKLYDDAQGSQQKLLQDNYSRNSAQLDAGKQASQALTDAYLGRTKVETPGVNNGAYAPVQNSGVAGREAQTGLSFGNRNQRNVTQLQSQQAQIDAEYERQRKLLGDMYASEIKKAQADNDMERAQRLYEAAKAEEEQLRAFRQQGANLMAEKDDMSLWESIAGGAPVQRDTATDTWDGVVKNEEAINKIYDAMNESSRLSAQMERDALLSELYRQQEEARMQTNEKLNQLYVDSMKSGRNAMETQNAYGQSSGVRAQSQIARGNQLTGGLTDLRKLQMERDAGFESKRLGALKDYGSRLYSGLTDTERKRVDALYGAAEGEEQALISEQEAYGKLLADKKGDYSVLGRLYGLTEEQIKAMSRGGVDQSYYTDDGPKTGSNSPTSSSGKAPVPGYGYVPITQDGTKYKW